MAIVEALNNKSPELAKKIAKDSCDKIEKISNITRNAKEISFAEQCKKHTKNF